MNRISNQWLIMFVLSFAVLAVLVAFNNASGAQVQIDSGNIVNETILEQDLHAINVAADDQVLTYDSASQGFAWSTPNVNEIDFWRIHTTFTGNAAPIASNFERVDSDSGSFLGVGMSESSGVFSFPVTGHYRVSMGAFHASSSGSHSPTCAIQDTQNNGGLWEGAVSSAASLFGTGSTDSSYCEFLFDVTDITTHKVRFHVGGANANVSTYGVSTTNYTFFTFVKLGDS